MITYVAILFMLLLLYWAFSTMFISEKKYRSAAYVSTKEAIPWKKATKLLEALAKSRINLSKDQRNKLEDLLYRAGWNESPEDVAAQQLMFGGIVTVGLGLFAIFAGAPFLLFVAVVAGYVFYRYPVQRLKKDIAFQESRAKQQLPDLIDLIILLFSAGLTPYQALKQATVQAPDSLKLACDRLSSELDSMPQEQALDNFASNIGIPAAKRFVFAMKQAMELSKKEALDIFRKQSELMRDMRVQNQRQIIKERPGKIQMVSMGVFMFVMLVPLGVIGVNFIKLMESMG